MSKSEFAGIRTLKELDAASRRVEAQLRRTGDSVSLSARQARSFYTPANLYSHLMDKVTPAISIAGFITDLYDRIRENINERRARRTSAAFGEKPEGLDAQTTTVPQADADATFDAQNESNV